jgi:general secretion pathway protein D
MSSPLTVRRDVDGCPPPRAFRLIRAIQRWSALRQGPTIVLALSMPVAAASLQVLAQAPAQPAPVPQQHAAPAPQAGPPAAQPPGPAAAPAQAQNAPAPSTAAAAHPAPSAGIGFRLENADLLQFISLVASQLKLNYVVDPAVKGTVTISTAGDLKREDLLPILEDVLKMNNATAIQTGNFYRIVPLSAAPKNPLAVSIETSGAPLPPDDRMIMQIVPLKFVFASDMAKILTPFLSEGGSVAVHESGNILILADDSLNVKRLMEILADFDSASFADERVRLIPVHNNVASGLAPELEAIFSAYALSDKTPLRFVPLDRINGILVAAADPSAFDAVQKWVEKLDQPAAPSGIQTFVYKVQNSEAAYLVRLLYAIRHGGAASVSAQPSNVTPGLSGFQPAGSGAGTGAGGFGTSGFGTGGPATGGFGGGPQSQEVAPTRNRSLGGAEAGALEGGAAAEGVPESGPHVVADGASNSIVIRGTAQEYADIVKTLQQLDVLPRQVLIEARVYEVDLTGNYSFGVEYELQRQSSPSTFPIAPPPTNQPIGSFTSTNNLSGSVGAVIGTRELLAFLNASENRSRIRMLSAPTVLATDSTDAHIQVGESVPVFTSQGTLAGAIVNSSSLQVNTITNVDTGVILTVNPRITSSGLVSLTINQEISSAQPPASTGPDSPSFLKRTVATHAVVADGETIALGGLIQYSYTTTTNRIPLLGDIPWLGALFGSTSYQKLETELIVLLTPRIISTLPSASAATGELRDKLKDLQGAFKKDALVNP